jgi:hypothetical protein
VRLWSLLFVPLPEIPAGGLGHVDAAKVDHCCVRDMVWLSFGTSFPQGEYSF